MYQKYTQSQGWQVEVLSANEGEHGGYKEIIARVSGIGVYGRLKFESGAHRVQRVPATESQGRVHTSACTVAVMPEVEIDDTVEINPSDLRIDTYRSSGAGGSMSIQLTQQSASHISQQGWWLNANKNALSMPIKKKR